MNNKNKILTSIIILILVFLYLFTTNSNANFFPDRGNEENEIEKSIDSEDGGIFEKIIAKMIGGIAQTVFNLTTSETFGVGFKEYDELIFSMNSTAISPFTPEQWNTMMKWYKIMSGVAGSLILLVVVIISYKFIVGGYSIEKRNEAKDSIMRLFFGAVSIVFAPIFVKFLLFLNNNLVQMLVGYSNGNLNDLIGNKVLVNIQTGNAIATAIVIAMFAYLFVKLNIKFIIRQFTILIFTLFTPIISIMWMINKRTIGAAIWFGQILINVFMQFIYAFLFLVYMQFLPQSGGWAISLLWAMMILPIADALQNTLQNLVSRIAGINNEELAGRGIGMAGAMAYSIKTIAYQFKGNETQNNTTSFLGRMFAKDRNAQENQITAMPTSKLETTPMQTTTINTSKVNENKKENKNDTTKINRVNNNNNISTGRKIYNTGKEFLNMGMYMAEGRNFKTNREYNRYNINNSRREDINKQNDEDRNIIENIKGADEE